MKHIVRAVVVALTLTGAVASTYAKSSAASVSVAKTSAFPIPSCPPGDPDGCGIGGNR
jgi:hypothetical protein